MRQLAETGWMHNRARMIVASFLVKDLLIDWRLGEQWFMDQLIDGDPAANNGGWQWTAGVGTDAAPYFRIFNPVLQSRKCDPSGAYIRRYVPELVGLSDEAIHEPWTLTPLEQRAGGVSVGSSYPAPIVDRVLTQRPSSTGLRPASVFCAPTRPRAIVTRRRQTKRRKSGHSARRTSIGFDYGTLNDSSKAIVASAIVSCCSARDTVAIGSFAWPV